MSMSPARPRRVRIGRYPQRGSFMLEALIAILIVALGVLGTVGLYARSVQQVDDAKFRGEAALLASSLIGQMWLSDAHQAALTANFDSGSAGPGYTEFAAMVAQRLPNSVAPTVTVTAGPNVSSSRVDILMQWKHPGDVLDPTFRQFAANATIGTNTP
jgi:type IV pilus assembly protein PilV